MIVQVFQKNWCILQGVSGAVGPGGDKGNDGDKGTDGMKAFGRLVIHFFLFQLFFFFFFGDVSYQFLYRMYIIYHYLFKKKLKLGAAGATGTVGGAGNVGSPGLTGIPGDSGRKGPIGAKVWEAPRMPCLAGTLLG